MVCRGDPSQQTGCVDPPVWRIATMNADGSNFQEVPAPCTGSVRNVTWSADGHRLFYGLDIWDPSNDPCSPSIHSVYLDGSCDTPIAGNLGDPLYIDARGTGSGSSSCQAPPWNVDPPQIAGLANLGETLAATTGNWTDSPSSYSYQWQRCDASGSNCADIVGGQGSGANYPTFLLTSFDLGSTLRVRVTATNAYGSSWAVSRATIPVLDTIAQIGLTYRPALLFDYSGPGSGEIWRPLEIHSFFAEDSQPEPGTEGIYICYAAIGCYPFTQPQQMMVLSLDPNDYLDIADAWDPQCHHDVAGTTVVDCDSGPHTAIYFEPGQDTAGYRYFDYWIFYRDNRPGGLFGQLDDHDGDWEGVTVVVDGLDPNSIGIAYAYYASHNGGQWYDGNALIAAGALSIGGTHPADYVARGTHASYPAPCSDSCSPASNVPWPWEAPHDGGAPWGANNDTVCASTCAQRFTESWWGDWPGRWGASTSPSNQFGWSPRSPGQQGRFTCAATGYSLGCTRPPGARAPTIAQRLTTSIPKPKTCESWFGGQVSVMACDVKLLRMAIRRHQMRHKGQLHLSVNGHHGGDSPGLAQVIGEPLVRGDRVAITGTGTSRTLVFFAIRIGAHLYHCKLRYVDLPHRSTIRLRIGVSYAKPVITAGGRRLPVSVKRVR